MTRLATLFAFALFASIAAAASAQEPLRVFISVDMEGIAGAVNNDDVGASGADYAHFRKIMAEEANAAIRGALLAGASEILVRDSHGGKKNILPADLLPHARLLRGASAGPKNMMEGIDATFRAAVFIGYHARAGTPNAVMEHTSNGNVIDMKINGVSMPEAGYNALVAGLYDVPVVFISGDRAFVDQARELLGPVEAVAVKEEIDGAIDSLSPLAAQKAIEEGVARGVNRLAQLKPYTLSAPYTLVLKVRREKDLYPGATRTGEGESTFTSDDLLEILNAFNAMK